MGKIRNVSRLGVAVAICLGVLITAASAKIITADRTGYFILGVDANGNPSAANGNLVPAKLFKDTKTGIVVGVFGGPVTNDSGRAQIYFSQGCTIEDPETHSFVFTEDDVEVVTGKKGRLKALAGAVCVYVPSSTPQ